MVCVKVVYKVVDPSTDFSFFSASLFFCIFWLIPSCTRESVIAKDEEIHMKVEAILWQCVLR